MSRCVTINGRKRKLCAASLDRLMTLQNRDIVAPLDFSGVEATEEFSNDNVVECMITTKNGATTFDSTNIERVLTHVFYCRYLEGITQETWIHFEGKRYDVVTAEDLDERHEWLRLNCTVRGDSTVPVNDA